MRITCVALIDQSRIFQGPRASVLDRIAEAIQIQVERDFAPAWGRAPVPVFVAQDGASVPLGAGLVYLVDRISHVKGAVGFHNADSRGFFAGFVAAESIARLGGSMTRGSDSISAAVSHEVLEMLANPAVNLWSDDGTGNSFAFEVCDPVSGDAYDVEVEPSSGSSAQSVSVSNFVLPGWFFPALASGHPVDHMQLLSRPFTHRETGYVVVSDSVGERELFGPMVPAAKRMGRSSDGRCARARSNSVVACEATAEA